MTQPLHLKDSLRQIVGIIILLALLSAGFFVGLMAIALGVGLAILWLAIAWWQRRKEGEQFIHAKFYRTKD